MDFVHSYTPFISVISLDFIAVMVLGVTSNLFTPEELGIYCCNINAVSHV